MNGNVLLNNGIEMPILGLGTFNLSTREAQTSVTNALNSGMRLIDTAAAYNNETGVGAGIKAAGVPRDQFFVTTKLWPSNYNMNGIDAALRNLDLDYIDLLLLHQPSGDYIGGYKAMEQAVADGKVRAIGLSNFSTSQFDEVVAAASILPAVHQVETHLHNQQAGMQRYIDQYGTLLEGWFPFGGRTNCQTFFNLPEVQEIAAGHGKSPAQTIIRWHLQSGHITIPGSRNADHIQENTQVFDFELTEEEMSVLNALNRNAAFFPGLGVTDEEAQERMQQWANEWGLNIN
ncbi:MAG: aldo/keto reductase [Lachnospiraceae bacterium]|nr:aldo/keto reductase [Lachnospiraceae bacterium]